MDNGHASKISLVANLAFSLDKPRKNLVKCSSISGEDGLARNILFSLKKARNYLENSYLVVTKTNIQTRSFGSCSVNGKQSERNDVAQ